MYTHTYNFSVAFMSGSDYAEQGRRTYKCALGSIVEYRVCSNRTQAKKIITILNFARFSGKGRHPLH